MSKPNRSVIRQRLYAEDPRCTYCGRVKPYEKTSLDHVQPRVAGGSDAQSNLVLVCRHCNFIKGGRTPAEILLWALRIVAVASR